MSDQVVPASAIDTTAAQSSAQAGAMLRQAREAQGLHIGALAVSLKVSVKRLEALEAGHFEELPDLVFARSLALSVCRSLKIDPAPVMAHLPELQASPFKATETCLNTRFKESGSSSRRGFFASVSTPIGLAVVALVVGIGAILTWPETPPAPVDSRASVAAAGAAVAVASDQQVPLEATGVAGSLGPVTEAALPATLAPGVQAPVSSPLETASKPAVLGTPAPAGIQDTATPGPTALLELNPRGESWVEVTDAAGLPRLRKLLRNGEMVLVTGQPPLSVTIGKADVMSVSVRGKPFDLTPVVRENVARFEVK